MDKLALPRSGDWNKFWENNYAREKKSVSFSKRRVLNIIQPYVVAGKYALDAGCGSGFFSKYFCDEGMLTTSLDYSSQALNIAKEMTGGRSNILQTDLLNPQITSEVDERFDLIFTDGLLEHFEADEQNLIMLNLKKLLREHGVLINFVPNKFSPWELIRPFYMPGIQEKPFDLKGLIALNVNSGLIVLRCGGINVWPFTASPDTLLGPRCGMLLYSIAKAHEPAQS